jgi:hypothetical protein
MNVVVCYLYVCALFDGFARSGYGVSRFELLVVCGSVISSNLVEMYVFGGMLRLQFQHKGAALTFACLP